MKTLKIFCYEGKFWLFYSLIDNLFLFFKSTVFISFFPYFIYVHYHVNNYNLRISWSKKKIFSGFLKMPLKKVKGKQIDRRMAREAAMKNTVHCACTARALCVHRAALRVHCACTVRLVLPLLASGIYLYYRPILTNWFSWTEFNNFNWKTK